MDDKDLEILYLREKVRQLIKLINEMKKDMRRSMFGSLYY
jgi:hypothetical protein